jgi:two-component system LytT family sensor kinase
VKQKYFLVVACAISWSFWCSVQALVMAYYGLPLRETLIDSALTASVLALAGFDVIMIVKYIKPSAKNSFYVFIASLVLAVLGTLLLRWILTEMSNDAAYLSALSSTLPVRLVFIWLMTVILAIQGKVWWFLEEQRQSEQRAKEMEQLVRDAELTGLRQQFQPHFIFNSLNSISALAGTNPTLARKMIEQLSDFLRGTVKKESSQLVSLGDELRHLQLYLDIEKVRFGHRLSTEVIAADDTVNMKLPSLLLQPVLENAIKFGLYDTIGEVVISVKAKLDGNNLVVEVKNPFDPTSAVPRAGTGFGLSSIQRRLSLLFYRNDLLTTNQNENTFTTTIKIPQG